MSQIMQKVQKAAVSLIIGEPFVGAVLSRLAIVYKPDLEAPAATDGKSIFWSDTFEEQPLPCITFVLAHEAMHVMSCHPKRRPAFITKLIKMAEGKAITEDGKRDLKRHVKAWHMATDVKINTHLLVSDAARKGLIRMPEDENGEPDGITAHALNMTIEEVMNQTEEAIYRKLLDSPPKNPPKQYDGPCDVLEEDKDALTEKEVAAAACQAELMAKGGRRTGAMGSTLIEQMRTTAVDYRRVLADVLTSTSGGERTWSRRSRRSGDVIMAGTRSQKIDVLTLVVDISASTRRVVPQFLDQIEQLLSTLPVERLRVIQHNTQVMDVLESDENTDATMTIGKVRDNLKSGGGTRFLPVVEDLKKHQASAAVVWLTDGASSDGCPSDIPAQSLIWVVPEAALGYANRRLTSGTVCSFKES